MENKTITIPSFDYLKSASVELILSKISELKQEIRINKVLYENSPINPNVHIKALIKEYEEMLNKSEDERNKRIRFWKGVLYKYYKMTLVKKSNNIEYKKTKYIFPYEIIDTNGVMCLLEINPEDVYEGGIKDTTYDINNNWDYDVYLEPITEDEFVEMMHKTCDSVIDRRLSKLGKKNS